MKRIRFFLVQIVALSITFILPSCEKREFLDRAPSDFVDENEVFSTIETAEAFLNSIYLGVPSLLIPSDPEFYFLDSGTDVSANMWSEWGRNSIDFNRGNWNPSRFPMQERWKNYYNAIRRIHVFLENSNLIPESDSNDRARKTRMIGEAHGLRAFYYFQLFKMFGDIPLIKTSLDPGGDQIILDRSPVSEIVNYVEEDLATAQSLLPARHSLGEFGRFTATAAKALRSRVRLYYASPLFNPEQDASRWADAETATRDALNYALDNNFALSTGTLNGLQEYERIFLDIQNPEMIWSNGFPDWSHDGDYWDRISTPLGFGGWWGEAPLQNMVDSYEMAADGELPVQGYAADDQQITNPATTYDPQNPYINRDPRFYQSIGYHGATYKGRTADFRPGGPDYATDRPRLNYFWKKFVQPDRDLYVYPGGLYQRRFPNFRLAELYINLAEIVNEIHGSTDEVWNLINTTRRRVGMIDIPQGLSKEQMRERIRREKKVEFALEGLRFWDVRRWKIAEVVDNVPARFVRVDANGAFTYPVWGQRVFEQKHYLFPIPQLELDKLDGRWQQNPGW